MKARNLVIALLAGTAVLAIGIGIGVSSGYDELSNAQVVETEAVDLEAIVQPEYGSNEVFQEALSAAPGHDLILADLRLPPDAVGDRQWHPWEEYVYVLGGSAVLDIEGMEQRTIGPGETFIIAPETAHTPRAGPTGVRAIIARVHDEGDPIMVPASEPTGPE